MCLSSFEKCWEQRVYSLQVWFSWKVNIAQHDHMEKWCTFYLFAQRPSWNQYDGFENIGIYREKKYFEIIQPLAIRKYFFLIWLCTLLNPELEFDDVKLVVRFSVENMKRRFITKLWYTVRTGLLMRFAN